MKIEPERITIKISTLCNLSCEMCSSRKSERCSDTKNDSFFSLNLFKKTIDEISEKFPYVRKEKLFSLILTGGEPFLHPNIFNMLAYAKTKNIGVTIFTNGTIIDQGLTEKIAKERPSTLMFSIDGPKEIHDQIRGTGNFEKTCKAIEMIQKQKIASGSRRPNIFINTVINNLNIGCLEELIFLGDRLRIKVLSFSHIQWSDQKLSERMLNELGTRMGFSEFQNKTIKTMEHNLNVKKNNLDELLKKIDLIKKNHQHKHLFPIIFLPDLSPEEINLWYSPNVNKINYCDSPLNWIRIETNGDVNPICVPITFPWGNIANQSLEEILNSKKANDFFTEIKNNGLFYACQRCCRRPSQSKILL